MQLTISNLLYFFATVAPLLLGFFLIMTSVFNQDIKGLVYLGGVLIACVINLFILYLIKNPSSPDASPLCNIIEFPFNLNQYNVPAFNSFFIAFTTAYMVLPMQSNGQMNYPILGSLLGLFALDAFTKVTNKCTTGTGVFLGALVGALLGFIWFTVFHYTGHDSLLYFNTESNNNEICTQPNKQTFKCSVYKNGKLIQSL